MQLIINYIFPFTAFALAIAIPVGIILMGIKIYKKVKKLLKGSN